MFIKGLDFSSVNGRLYLSIHFTYGIRSIASVEPHMEMTAWTFIRSLTYKIIESIYISTKYVMMLYV